MSKMAICFSLGCCFLFLVSCSTSSQPVLAPVTDFSTIENIPKSGLYKAKPGDSVYSVAFRYGMDYRTVAKRNKINSSAPIHPGEVIYLNPTPEKNNDEKTIAARFYHDTLEPVHAVSAWQWPAQGPVIREFGGPNKGIDIGAAFGAPVVATAAGKVVYSGNGLKAYGNLIIIKHNKNFLSAYAHMNSVYVKQGATVSGGQKIATVGKTGARTPILHFEIRHNGVPVNPLIYLAR